MRDRLLELRDEADTRHGEVSSRDAEVPQKGSLSLFLKKVELIRKDLDDIDAANVRLATLHQKLYDDVQPSQSVRNEANATADKIRSMAIKTRKQINELHTTLAKPPSTTSLRMLQIQEAGLSSRLQDALGCLSAEQVRHRDRTQALLQAQLRIVRGSQLSEDTEEEVRLLDFQQLSIFTDNLELRTREAQRELDDLNERHSELLKLEHDIQDVHDLFVEISLLVESQGELITSIESSVMKASEHVESGQQNLDSADKKKKSARKKKWAIMLCGTVTIVILVSVAIIFIF